MNYRRQNKLDKKGFTIVELMIASSIFGVILLVATSGILFIGRTYYKGIISSKTQSSTRSITQDISNTFQFAGAADTLTTPNTGGAGIKFDGYTVTAQCIGKVRYTYITGARVADRTDVTQNLSRHALWVDIIKEGSTCAPFSLAADAPSDTSTDTSTSAVNQRRELIPQNMRLDQFTLNQPVGNSFISINLRVIYGDIDLSPAGICTENRLGGQFCATSALNTTVTKRL